MYLDQLYHYGVKGMKWGVRKLDERNGDLYLKKGTVVKRVATDYNDTVSDNKKYVSINEKDHEEWEKYLGENYLDRGVVTTVHSYTTVKDLKVMDSTKQGELFAEMMLNKKFKNQALKDIESYYKLVPLMEKTNDNAEIVSSLISKSKQLETGRKFVDEVMSRGYDAMIDTHGMDISETPLIVLNADTNLKKINVEYSKAVKDYCKRRYNIDL